MERLSRHVDAIKATLGLMVGIGEISKHTKETLEIGINGISEIVSKKLVKNNVALADVRLSLPSHIDAGKEAKKYGDEMNSKGKLNGFHELDFYNGTVWLRAEIEGNEA